MRYGIHTFSRGATAQPADLHEVAGACDRLGFDYFGLNDHVVVCARIDSTYPYTEDGSWAGAKDGACLEVLTTLGYIAALTQRVRLLTSVMVIPHRPPVLTAKTLATLDVLSGGRLTVGVGVGWMREELAALGAPSYERRGTASDEYIEAFRCLWREDVAHFSGEFVSFTDVVALPKPVQQPAPPLWVGGEGTAARRRAARRGDGWYPVASNPRHPLDTPQRFEAAVADVRQRAERAGRDPDRLDVALFVPWSQLGEPMMTDGKRRPFTGPADAILDDVDAFERCGLGVLVVNLGAPSASELVDKCEAFAEAVGMRSA